MTNKQTKEFLCVGTLTKRSSQVVNCLSGSQRSFHLCGHHQSVEVIFILPSNLFLPLSQGGII